MKMVSALTGLTLLLAPSLPAGAEKFGSWTVEAAGGWVHTSTVNSSGHIFLHSCDSTRGRCLWSLGISRLTCEVGLKYSLLANSGSEAVSLEAWCLGALPNNKEVYRYGFRDYEVLNRLVTRGTRIAFAFPVSPEGFRTVQFQLARANSVVSAMRAVAEARSGGGRGKTQGETVWVPHRD
jgi:hypothetical protein